MKTIKPLIDGDLLAYKASVGVQKDIYWGDGLYTCHAYLDDAIDNFNQMLNSIIEHLILMYPDYHMDVPVLCFSDKNNFRKTIFKEYKTNRSGTRKPTCYWGLVDYIRDNHNSVSMPNLEGDDVLGLLAVSMNSDNTLPIIVSLDKDFKTVPATFYNFGKDEVNTYSKSEAYRNLMVQCLTGDTTDGYSGCSGVGRVTARRLVDSCSTDEEIWGKVLDKFKRAGHTEDYALTMVRCAYILHEPEDYSKDGEVNLFTPK